MKSQKEARSEYYALKKMNRKLDARTVNFIHCDICGWTGDRTETSFKLLTRREPNTIGLTQELTSFECPNCKAQIIRND